MTNYLLDANHLSPLVTLTHPLHQKIIRRLQAGDVFSIPAPALPATLFGFRMLPRAKKNIKEWEQPKFIYIGVDKEDAEQAAELQVMLRRRGWQLKTVDALIAAIALRYDLILLTRDKDFNARA
jgi:tRNA(fMet)-specific endonuclease VapC